MIPENDYYRSLSDEELIGYGIDQRIVSDFRSQSEDILGIQVANYLLRKENNGSGPAVSLYRFSKVSGIKLNEIVNQTVKGRPIVEVDLHTNDYMIKVKNIHNLLPVPGVKYDNKPKLTEIHKKLIGKFKYFGIDRPSKEFILGMYHAYPENNRDKRFGDTIDDLDIRKTIDSIDPKYFENGDLEMVVGSMNPTQVKILSFLFLKSRVLNRGVPEPEKIAEIISESYNE